MLEEGIGHLRKALELAPDSAEAYFDLGVAEFRRGNKPEAMKCWSRAAELNPDNYEAHHNLAVALEEQGNVDQAIEHYRKAAQLKPDDAMAQAHLGNCPLCERGDPGGPGATVQGGGPRPRQRAIRYNLASTLAGSNSTTGRSRISCQILRLDPRNTNALLSLAASYARDKPERIKP